jgi:transposase
VSRLNLELEPKAAAGRRIEVIRGGGERRRWSADEKARAVEASFFPDAVVSEVARLHGVTPQQLFTWRRQARQKASGVEAPPFVPAVLDRKETLVPEVAPDSLVEAAEGPASLPPSIELDIDGASVWIWRDADTAMVTAIIGALKAHK